MNVITLQDEQAIGRAVGDLVCDFVKENPAAVLGLPTGATPIPTYQRMIEQCGAGELSFAGVTTFNLDEYCGLPVAHPESYRSFMRTQLFGRIDIQPENTHIPDGNAPDPQAECARYDAAIARAGGIGLQLLGIGRNGHIGFNEPGEAFTAGTFKTELTPSTLAANSKYFTDDDPMPRFAMTMGVGVILKAEKIVLIATGESKARAVKDMLEGSVGPGCPASALRSHGNVTVYLDTAAASLLSA